MIKIVDNQLLVQIKESLLDSLVMKALQVSSPSSSKIGLMISEYLARRDWAMVLILA